MPSPRPLLTYAGPYAALAGRPPRVPLPPGVRLVAARDGDGCPVACLLSDGLGLDLGDAPAAAAVQPDTFFEDVTEFSSVHADALAALRRVGPVRVLWGVVVY